MCTISGYSRCTELRNVQPNDLYRLAVILDENNYWKKLMEIIPKDLNNQLYGDSADSNNIFSILGTSERKYQRDMIRLVEREFERSGESRLCSQILFDEWGSSGRKLERPTLGVLLHLLVYVRLYRAADFVAESLLKEPKPTRPLDGPGAEITCDFPTSFFEDIHKMANESQNYPDTEMLQLDSTTNLINNNKDYYTKYREHLDKHLDDQIVEPPIPPPRLQKTARLNNRLLKTQIICDTSKEDVSINEKDLVEKPLGIEASAMSAENNIPKISILMNSSSIITDEKSMGLVDHSMGLGDSLPKLSFLRENSDHIVESADCAHSSINVPNIHSNLINTQNINHGISDDSNMNRDLPAISELNLNGERDSNSSNLLGSCENVPSVVKNTKNSISKLPSNLPIFIACIAIENKTDHFNHSSVEINVNSNNNSFPLSSDDAEDVPNLSIFNDSS